MSPSSQLVPDASQQRRRGDTRLTTTTFVLLVVATVVAWARYQPRTTHVRLERAS